MIRSAKEAKEIIKKTSTITVNFLSETDNNLLKISEAKGYLSALDGPEVKALMEALIDVYSGIPNFSDSKWSNYCHKIAFDSIFQFRKAVKT